MNRKQTLFSIIRAISSLTPIQKQEDVLPDEVMIRWECGKILRAKTFNTNFRKSWPGQ